MYLGTRRRLMCEFRDFAIAPATVGAVADPDSVSVLVYLNGTQTSDVLTPIRDSQGEYHVDYIPAVAGKYRIVWVGAGAVAAADVDLFTVVAP